MIGFRPGIYWRICWKFIAPCFLLVIGLADATLYGPTVGKLQPEEASTHKSAKTHAGNVFLSLVTFDLLIPK